MTEIPVPFAIIPMEAALDHRLTASQYRVLLAILSWRNKDTNMARVSREKIASRCGYKPSTVSRVTSQLQDLGWIEKEGSGGRSQWSAYRLTVPDLETVSDPGTVAGSETVADPGTKRCRGRALNGVGVGHETVSGSDRGIQQKDYINSTEGLQKEGAQSREADSIRQVFEYWQERLEHPKTILDDKRRRKIRARLREGYTVSDLKVAIDGILRSDFHMGRDPKNDQVYDDIELICRSAPHVDKFIRLASQQDLSALSKRGRSNVQAAQRWLKRHEG